MWFPMLTKHISEHARNMRHYLTDDFSNLDPESRRRKVTEVRNTSAAAAAAVAPMPIPFADIWTITPIQMVMVKAIANIYGHRMDAKTARAVFATIGGGWLGRQTFIGLLKIGLPGLGEIGGAAFAYMWTQGLGRTAELYFSSEKKASGRDSENVIDERGRKVEIE